LLVVASAIYWTNAWIADDAYITFRSVEQLHAGHGPRWNPHERVQAFTHPLWFGLLAGARLVTADLFDAALVLGFLLTLATFTLASRAGGVGLLRRSAGPLLLLGSKSVVDFSSSGLENALSGLLVALAAWGCLDGEDAPGRRLARPGPAALLVSAVALTRPDLVLLVLPWLVATLVRATRRVGVRRAAGASAAGLAPLVAWGLFALVWYGFPVPNTAYAKLATGIDPTLLWAQGLVYARTLLLWDPVGATTLVVGLGLLALRPGGRPLALGLALQALYVVRIGGDFMAGRFFQPLVVVAAVAAARLAPKALLVTLVALAALASVAHPRSPLRFGLDALVDRPAGAHGPSGITDEKLYWFRRSSLRHRPVDPPVDPNPSRVRTGREIGWVAYRAPLDAIFVDEMALTDPFLARLPVTGRWRIGHFRRALPGGYLESLREGGNRLIDPPLRPLYDRVVAITRGPLFTRARWRAIAELNLRPPDLSDVRPSRYEVVVEPRGPAPGPDDPIGGRVSLLETRGAELRLEGTLDLDPAEPGIRFLLRSPERPFRVLIDPPARAPDGRARFGLTVTFPSSEAATRAAASCLDVSSRTTPSRVVEMPEGSCTPTTTAGRPESPDPTP